MIVSAEQQQERELARGGSAKNWTKVGKWSKSQTEQGMVNNNDGGGKASNWTKVNKWTKSKSE